MVASNVPLRGTTSHDVVADADVDPRGVGRPAHDHLRGRRDRPVGGRRQLQARRVGQVAGRVAGPHGRGRLDRPAGLDRAREPDVLRHRPGQRRRRPGRLAGQVAVRRGRGLVLVPHLLGDHVAVVGGVRHRAQVRQAVAAVGDHVLAALAAEQRPRPALGARRVERPRLAGVLLAVAVEGVAVPDPAARRVRRQRGVRLGERRPHVPVAGRLHPEPDQLQEAGVDDLLLRVYPGGVAPVPRVVVIRVGVGVDAQVVAPIAVRPGGGEHPLLGVALPLVGDAEPQPLAQPVTPPGGDLRGGDQPGDLGRGGRRRVAAGLLPALLRGRRARPHQRLRGPADAVPQVGAPQLVRQHERERGLVELDVALVRLTVHPGVLREGPVRLLLALEEPVTARSAAARSPAASRPVTWW